MNEWQALDTFWNGFGLPAYDSNTVPDDQDMPYITYEVGIGSFGDILVLDASLWYKSTGWKDISEKAKQISDSIGGGTGVSYDGGRLWITKVSSFATRMAEPEDPSVRRILMTITAEFQTAF